jgi:cardiolipin synthase
MNWPNALTILRLGVLGVFAVGAFLGMSQITAFALLFVAGSTDWLDGWLARRLNQISRLGEILDPIADRLFTLALVLYLLFSNLLPLWFVILLLGRDVLVTLGLALLQRRGQTGVTVTYTGKVATFTLLIGLPLILFADIVNQQILLALAWAFALWGLALYWLSAVEYLTEIRRRFI